MDYLQWLLMSDPSVSTMTQRHLLDRQVPDATEGWIHRLFDLYKPELHGWGKGIYSHKWISDHYTLLELLELEADGHDPRYVDSISHLISVLWHTEPLPKKTRGLDMCVAAMLLRMGAYAHLKNERLNEIVDYILKHPMSDGGWNCCWDAKPECAHKSSLHTTLSVLEAIHMYHKNGYRYRLDELLVCVPEAEEFILKKRLFRSVHTGEIINERMIEMHFPVRWFYDAYRALLYFIDSGHGYDKRMQEAIDRLKEALEKGPLPKGGVHTGLQHFKVDVEVYRAMNTLRGLRILKAYDLPAYHKLIHKEIE